MTLTQLRAFLETVRRGSFTGAAQALEMSQASVSELIRRLEDEYHVQLFLRGKRQLALTAAGQELLHYAEAAITAADNGARALRAVQSLDGGVATFGVMRNADYYLLSGLVQRFHELHPGVRVRLIGLNSTDVAASVADGSLEAGLVVLPIDSEGLVVTPWARDEVVYVTASAERAARPVTIEQFAAARLVLYDAHVGWRDPTRRQIADRADLAGLKVEPWIEVEHVESALNLVARGAGDTMASRAVMARHGLAGLYVASMEPPLYDAIAFVRRHAVPLSAATTEIAHLAHTMLRRSKSAAAVPAVRGS